METLRTNNVPYHSDVKRERSLISKLFFIIGNRMIAFINKIETMTGRLFYVICSTIFRKSNVLRKNVPTGNHPKLISKDSDSFASASHCSSGLNYKTSKISKYDFHDINLLRISTKEESNGIREIKHSIIEDKKNNKRYLSIGTSSHNCDLILTRDLGRPYKVQRSLLIRSRLKNSLNSQDYPHPFSLLKRTEENVLLRQAKRNENIGMIKENKKHQLKSSEKFWILSEIVEINETNGKLLDMRKYESEEQILNKYLYDIKNNVPTVQKHTVVDNTAISNELVINVHNYLELQTEINKNVYKHCDRSACLLISNN